MPVLLVKGRGNIKNFTLVRKIKRRAARILREALNPSYPNWARLLRNDRLRWQQALAQAENGPRVLIATSVGAHIPAVTMESALAVALTLRGAKPSIFLCDGALPACLHVVINSFPDLDEFVKYGPARRFCKSCFKNGHKTYRSLNMEIDTYSDCLSADDKERVKGISLSVPADQIGDYRLDGLAVGEHALAGALRFFARGDLDGEAVAEPVLRRYFEASLLTVFATRKLLEKRKFDTSVFHHGIYVPQGLIAEVLRKEQVRVVNWSVAYRKRSFIFSHGDTYHHTLLSEPVSNWQDLDLTPQMETDLLDYLKSRWYGTNDWVWFHEKPDADLSLISKQMGIDFSKPTIGLLTNVIWDAQLHYRANAFSNMLEWLFSTIDYFAKRPELQLVIRVHPAEIRGTVPSRQRVVEEIKKAGIELPGNIFVIGPESPISTYATMRACNAVLIYGTKTGVELTSIGVPVIVGGEAWIRNKGVTFDADSSAEYFALLDRLPLDKPLDEVTVKRARKYAYHFFFRRMVPVASFVETGVWPPFKLGVSNLDELLPGSDLGLDVICDGILSGKDFIYRAELAREIVASHHG